MCSFISPTAFGFYCEPAFHSCRAPIPGRNVEYKQPQTPLYLLSVKRHPSSIFNKDKNKTNNQRQSEKSINPIVHRNPPHHGVSQRGQESI
jgi:hypothetical protein